MDGNKNITKFTPDLAKALETFGRAIKFDTMCHRVATIKNWYPERLVADVEILGKRKNLDGTVYSYPLLLDVPVIIPYGNNCGLSLGDLTGCEVLLHFNDRDIDNWFETGSSMLPNSDRLHSINDCFAELRIFSQPNKIEYDNTGVVLHNGGLKVRLGTKDDKPTITLENGTWSMNIVEDTATISGKITMTGDIDLTGNIMASGDITAQGDIKAGNISLKEHIHKVNGVQAGGASVDTDTPQ